MVRRASGQAEGGALERREGELPVAKRAQIVGGARLTFSELGYERASVDAIAARAGVSKATIYKHFKDKQALFLEVLEEETRDLRDQFHEVLETPTGDIEADLRRLGRHLLRLTCDPKGIRRFRLVAAEAQRFPELGRQLHEGTMLAGKERMGHFFRLASEAGQLEVEDPNDAAVDFTGMLIHALTLQLQLGVLTRVSPALMETHVERTVRTFLRAYGPRPKGRR